MRWLPAVLVVPPSCYHVDPEYSQTSQLGDRGYYGASFAMPPRPVAEARDVLVAVEAHSAGQPS
jgi:hypothetical protein